MRINCLPASIFNKIAAGEVVERPASIVKELVENSIDAGSTSVCVKITEGGIKEINVSDNGCGINFDDLKTAFLPHATSKIVSEDDLVGIKTLGFRGEALASISAVSEVSLKSKEATAENGGMIEISGGTIITSPTIVGVANGTDITVSNLFFNVPARAKFLKKPKTEEAEITSLMQKFILANPCVAFKYIVDGKIKLLSTGKGILDALFVVHGKEAVDNSIELDYDFGHIKIYGYIGRPEISKPNRTYQTIIINNRVIENVTISSAVQNAYGEMLMKKQFPLFALYIDIDFSQVDVNVHPNKKEVRFENSREIYLKVFESVNRALTSQEFTKTITIEEPKIEPKEEPKKEFTYSVPEEITLTPIVDYNSVNESIGVVGTKEQQQERRTIFSALRMLEEKEDVLTSGAYVGSQLLEELSSKIENSQQLSIKEADNTSVSIVGVVFNTYIMVQDGDLLYFIDQHAGHERLLYDKLMSQIKSKDLELQPLLVPYVFNVNSAEQVFIGELIPNLEALGFSIEEFGSRSFRVTCIPYLLSALDMKKFFNSLFEDMKSLQNITMENILKNEIASRACKSAVKGGDSLNLIEVKILLKEFVENGNRLLCPHGRPIVVKLPQKELEKWFKRIV